MLKRIKEMVLDENNGPEKRRAALEILLLIESDNISLNYESLSELISALKEIRRRY